MEVPIKNPSATSSVRLLNSLISLTLQCSPLDLDQTFELVQLICDIERKRREGTEFFLVYRKDCPIWVGREFEKLARSKFQRVSARMARNHDTGWPAGPNMLAGSAFIEMTLLRREGTCQNEGFLLFEPDCIPLARDWIDRLSAEWDRVSALGKEAFGHWHVTSISEAGPEIHLNGNAVWRTNFFDEHPGWIIGAGTQGWDYFFRDKFLPISVDSNLIFQHWNRHGISEAELDGLQKNGERPVFFHGIKTPEGRAYARKTLVS
jgi:hypothetical protein